MLSKNAGVTYAPHNIRVNCVLPGYVDTPMSRGVTPSEAEDADRVHAARPPRRAARGRADDRLPGLRRSRASSRPATSWSTAGWRRYDRPDAARASFALGDFALRRRRRRCPTRGSPTPPTATLNAARDNVIVLPDLVRRHACRPRMADRRRPAARHDDATSSSCPACSPTACPRRPRTRRRRSTAARFPRSPSRTMCAPSTGCHRALRHHGRSSS